jgi:hypothetical protein
MSLPCAFLMHNKGNEQLTVVKRSTIWWCEKMFAMHQGKTAQQNIFLTCIFFAVRCENAARQSTSLTCT